MEKKIPEMRAAKGCTTQEYHPPSQIRRNTTRKIVRAPTTRLTSQNPLLLYHNKNPPTHPAPSPTPSTSPIPITKSSQNQTKTKRSIVLAQPPPETGTPANRAGTSPNAKPPTTKHIRQCIPPPPLIFPLSVSRYGRRADRSSPGTASKSWQNPLGGRSVLFGRFDHAERTT